MVQDFWSWCYYNINIYLVCYSRSQLLPHAVSNFSCNAIRQVIRVKMHSPRFMQKCKDLLIQLQQSCVCVRALDAFRDFLEFDSRVFWKHRAQYAITFVFVAQLPPKLRSIHTAPHLYSWR